MAYKAILDSMATRSAQKNINLETIASLASPLPPMAEQKRIVACVEELLAMCDALKWKALIMSDFNLPSIPAFNIQAPDIPEINIDTPAQLMWADEQFEILKKYIQAFEKSLDPEH